MSIASLVVHAGVAFGVFLLEVVALGLSLLLVVRLGFELARCRGTGVERSEGDQRAVLDRRED